MPVTPSRLLILPLAVVLSLCAGLPVAAQAAPECIASGPGDDTYHQDCALAAVALASPEGPPMQTAALPGGNGAAAFFRVSSARAGDVDPIAAFDSDTLLNIAAGKFAPLGVKDVRWLAAAGIDYGAVIVRGDAVWRDLQELMDLIAEDPGAVTLTGRGGVGSSDWMKAALLVRAAGADFRAMRYRRVEGDRIWPADEAVTVHLCDLVQMQPLLESGAVRILGVMAPARLPAPFDGIRTLAEQGWDVEWPVLHGFYAGKSMPDADYRRLADLMRAAYPTGTFAQAREARHLLPLDLAGGAFQSLVEEQVGRFETLSRQFGLIAD